MDEITVYQNLRKFLYSLLGDCFYTEPNKKYYDTLIKNLPVIVALLENSGAKKALEGVEILKSYVWSEDSEDALAKEFSSIFLVSDVFTGKKPITPHESVYLSLGGLSMQEERDKVLEKFYAAGVKKQEGFTEPEDHIKSEFDFMSVMTAKTLELLENDDTEGFMSNIVAQKTFMDEHISRWCQKMCDDVADRAKSTYFKGLALICAGYVTSDSKFLNELSVAFAES